jgi:FkbM family methyltransferase
VRQLPRLPAQLPPLMNDLAFAIRKPRLILDAIVNLRSRLADWAAMEETFIRQVYRPLFAHLRERTVLIDIGSYIGDSAIYFAQSPLVKCVIGFEPMLSSYRRAVENIDVSPFRNKITMINAAVGGASGTREVGNHGSAVSRLEGRGHRIKVETLKDIIQDAENVAIKCDCEGEETEIFEAADLGNVYAVQLEYHDTRDAMATILKRNGFQIKYLDDHRGHLYESIGYILATRPSPEPEVC